MCPEPGIRIIASVASLYRWRLLKPSATLALLQISFTACNVFVFSPKEIPGHGSYSWLLLTAAYEFCNAIAKFQVHSDGLLYQTGFTNVLLILLLLTLHKKSRLIAIARKVVHSFLLSGSLAVVDPITRKTNSRFQLGTALSGQRQQRFFRVNTIQQTTTFLRLMPMTNLKSSIPICFLVSDVVNLLSHTSVELKSFVTLKCSLCWIGYSFSTFCSEQASGQKKNTPKATVRDLPKEKRGMRNIKRLGTSVSYKNAQHTLRHAINLVVFSDADKNHENAQAS